ncbi:hypothetical protein Trydic_g11612 [Trypoxylus dichotomus]
MSLRGKKKELGNEFEEMRADILAITETKTKERQMVKTLQCDDIQWGKGRSKSNGSAGGREAINYAAGYWEHTERVREITID